LPLLAHSPLETSKQLNGGKGAQLFMYVLFESAYTFAQKWFLLAADCITIDRKNLFNKTCKFHDVPN
jgi:hypothetical protein